MFCKNCGKEIMNGDKFCTRCGTATGAQPVPATSAELFQTAAAKVGPLKDKLVTAGGHAVDAALPAARSGLNWLKNNSATVVPLAKAAAMLLMIVLWFSKLVRVSVMGVSQEFSMLDMSEGVQWISYLTAVLLAAGAACTVFPRRAPKWNIPMIACGWTCFWFLSSVLTASSQVSDYSRYNPEFSLTAAGWLLGILSVGMLVLLLLDLRKRKKAA